MPKLSYINTPTGVCLWYKGEFVPINTLAKAYGFDLQDEDDIWFFIEALSNVLIEEGH